MVRLHPDVALRDEPFGALAYHYGNRKLVFVKDRELLALLRRLPEGGTLETGLADHPADQRPRFLAALQRLEASDMLIHD